MGYYTIKECDKCGKTYNPLKDDDKQNFDLFSVDIQNKDEPLVKNFVLCTSCYDPILNQLKGDE